MDIKITTIEPNFIFLDKILDFDISVYALLVNLYSVVPCTTQTSYGPDFDFEFFS